MAGDTLARGARSAVFPPAGGNVSQERWDALWAEDNEAPKQITTNREERGKAGEGQAA